VLSRTLAFAPVPAGVEWFPMRAHTRAHLVEALVPPGSTGRSLGDGHPRAGWSLVAWDARDGWLDGEPDEPHADLAVTVREALTWCGRASGIQSWVIDTSASYVAYLRWLLQTASLREGGVSPPMAEQLGDPTLDLLLELAEAARRRPTQRAKIESALGAHAAVDARLLLRPPPRA
jgi:hypothetical protein